MRCLLIGNYVPDGSQSMARFAEVLSRELSATGWQARVLCPPARLGALVSSRGGPGKWLGYADKFLLFPARLRREIAALRTGKEPFVIHLCDQASAPYTRALAGVPHLLTCNDLLAVRSARGEFPQNPVRWSGRRLQAMILAGVRRAAHIAAISEATRADVMRVAGLPPERVTHVPMGLNHPYSPMPAAEARARMAKFPAMKAVPEGARWLLHVGGNQWYKNRSGVLRAFAELNSPEEQKLHLIMAGEPLPQEWLRALADDVRRRVISVTGADNEDVRALYSQAEMLVFPSLAEGFGWPVIEAQACGCRVVTSDRAPMCDIASDAAHTAAPEHPAALAAAIRALRVESPDTRARRVAAGLANAARYSTRRMTEAYASLYSELTA